VIGLHDILAKVLYACQGSLGLEQPTLSSITNANSMCRPESSGMCRISLIRTYEPNIISVARIATACSESEGITQEASKENLFKGIYLHDNHYVLLAGPLFRLLHPIEYF
jgi:hypothetical protein